MGLTGWSDVRRERVENSAGSAEIDLLREVAWRQPDPCRLQHLKRGYSGSGVEAPWWNYPAVFDGID
ncbi:unnamed protein product [Cuscuta campestris]|uniref:Uncharacterized protein n=1 Tax=Cuscuta campestris TaxID=132261 RepID=A0A484NPV2_9ASTE|nr:unnamed protein product [Cuscuta campestris]